MERAATIDAERRAAAPRLGPAVLAERRRFLEAHVGAAFTLGNRVRALHNGDAIFPPMLRAIREARHSVNLLTYIYRRGAIAERFCEHLCERARAGVTTRLLLDSIGAAEIASDQVKRMRAAGVDVRWFRKPFKVPWKADQRSHRKILVCDNRIGFTGGMGIGERWQGDARDSKEWREMHFEFKGPSVYGLNASFWENWIEACPEADPVASDLPVAARAGDAAVQVVNLHSGRSDQAAMALTQSLFTLAQRRIDIVTAYLAPDRRCLELLKKRAVEGIAVRVLIPGRRHNDVRLAVWEAERYFSEMLAAGIRIFRYQPTMMHSKAMLIDDDLALCGSLNFDKRSFRKDEEVAAVVQDPGLVAELDRALQRDLAASHEIRREHWKGRPLSRKLLGLLTLPFRGEL